MNRLQSLLVRLMEECSEVTQAASKAALFGIHDGYPNTDRSNIGDLKKEFTDLVAVVELLEEEIGTSFQPNPTDINAKKAKVEHWILYAAQAEKGGEG